MRSLRLWLIAILVMSGIVTCQACAFLDKGPDVASEEAKEGQKYANADVRRMFVDQPFLASGDYFRERTWNNATTWKLGDRNQTEQGENTQQEHTAALERRIADLEESLAASRSQDGSGFEKQTTSAPKKDVQAQHQAKIGFLLDSQSIGSEDGDRLRKAIQAVARASSRPVFPDQTLRDILAPTSYIEDRNLTKISQALSLYPGVRMLVMIESFGLPESFPGQVRVKLGVVDTGIPYRYPILELAPEVRAESDVQSVLHQVLAKTEEYAADKASTMPGHYRVFDRQQGRVVINGGKRTGLSPGAKFRVVPGGQVVKAPTGVPAGWIPEPAVGYVRVEDVLGPDAAVCSVLAGELPKPGAYVLPKSSKSDE